MNYVIKAAFRNAQHPEYGKVTIDFPIPDEEYDHTIEQLEELGVGHALGQDCHITGLDSSYAVLSRLEGSAINVDELDYLAKRLDSFVDSEAAQFQGMAAKLDMDVKTLQYLMGHSDVGVTLNTYTHATYDRAVEQMVKLIDFQGAAEPDKLKKSG